MRRDRSGEIFEDDLTENDQPTGSQREDVASDLDLDPNVDSQADDADSSADTFGNNERASPP